MKYICNVTCWVGGKKKAMFTPGEIVDFAEDEMVPGHFTCIEPPQEEPMKEEPKFEETKVENTKVEEVKAEPSFIEPKEEEKSIEIEKPKLRKPRSLEE